jgi:hypothetical protein
MDRNGSSQSRPGKEGEKNQETEADDADAEDDENTCTRGRADGVFIPLRE